MKLLFTLSFMLTSKLQTYIFSSNRIHNLKYLRSQTLGCKDVEIRDGLEAFIQFSFCLFLFYIFFYRTMLFRWKTKIRQFRKFKDY